MQTILAAVANRSLFKTMLISSIRFNSSQFNLRNYKIIKVTGADREAFFQGQVTNDLSKISLNEGQLTARLNRTGKVQSFFFIAKLADSLLLLCPKGLTSSIKDDFEKYIIMEDVVLENCERDIWIQLNPFLNTQKAEAESFNFNFYGIESRLVFYKDESLNTTDENELEEIRILNGWPVWGADVDSSQFINDSYLNEIAISYKKGCFLGQETVAKIENNRGAAYYPVLLELDGTTKIAGEIFIQEGESNRRVGTVQYQIGNLARVLLFRDLRVMERVLELSTEKINFKAKVSSVPYYKSRSREEMAQELYHEGIKKFQQDELQIAIQFMEKALQFNPQFADVYEVLGVILGRQEKFNEAIEWMNKLQQVNPNSVMAHTNKSLYLMKLGLIAEAEAEKSLATVKSFASFGEEAKFKKELENEKKKKEEENNRREKMFLQVLEIDDSDEIALYGMADIFFQKNKFQEAIANLEKLLITNQKYSTAYLLLGKSYEGEGSIEKAKDIYAKGIIVASKLGDMMPANEMQVRLNQLIVGATIV